MFEEYLRSHLRRYPAMQARDVVKLCYQASFGSEHLLSDPDAAYRTFMKEYECVPTQPGELCEALSDDVCRVHLSAWKAAALPPQWLFRMFLLSAAGREDGKAQFTVCLNAADHLLQTGQTPIPYEAWRKFLAEYEKLGTPAVHHSEEYRRAEAPAYRIVSRRIGRILPILSEAAKAETDRICVIALDGRAASGKSTMARHLAAVLEADIVHMDDFFLPPALRTEERFAVPGANVHYERFAEEVLPHLHAPAPFACRRFDCGKMDYDGTCRIESMPFRIVEGSYALHPHFGDYADIAVFSDVLPDEQMRRIRLRNGEKLAKMFETRWIPWEEAYFTAYGIREKADRIL